VSSRQLCPACSQREARLIDPHCLICDGTGIMWLGDPALTLYPAAVVAEAVDITLEAAARLGDTGGTLSDDRLNHVRAALLALRDAGVLDPECTTLTHATAPMTRAKCSAVELAEGVLQEPILPLDSVLARAAPYEYSEDDRPGQRGLPVLSQNGHPSHLARLCDPRDPYMDTPADVRRRRRKNRQGTVLAEAVKHMAALPYRGRNRQTVGQLELISPDTLSACTQQQEKAAA